jgi:hypothetical protein
MNKRTITTGLMALLFPALASAASLPEYSGRLRKNGSAYRLHVTHNGAEVTESLPPDVRAAIQKQLNTFAASNVTTPANPDVAMTVTVQSGLQLALEFKYTTPRRQGFFSCFRSWYVSLPKAASTELNQLALVGVLSNSPPDATQELERYAGAFSQFIQRNISTCPRQFPEFPLVTEDDVYLHTGLTQWANGLLGREFLLFANLLNGPAAVFDARRGDPSSQISSAEYIAAWLTGVKQRATPPAVIANFTKATDAAGESPSSASFTLQVVRHWASSADIHAYIDRNVMSPDLQRVIQSINTAVDACFDSQGHAKVYLCGPDQDIKSRILNFTFANDSVGAFSFLLKP